MTVDVNISIGGEEDILKYWAERIKKAFIDNKSVVIINDLDSKVFIIEDLFGKSCILFGDNYISTLQHVNFYQIAEYLIHDGGIKSMREIQNPRITITE